MGVQLHVSMDVWGMDACEYGCMGVWMYGSTDVWEYGCMGV